MLNFFAMKIQDLSFVLVAQEENGPPELVTTGGQLFYSILIFAFVLCLAYYITKVVGTKRMQVLNTKNMRIIEMISLGVGVSLAIVEVGGRHLLVSISKERVSLVAELDKETLIFNEKGNSNYNFSEQFKKLLNKGKDNDDEII